MGLRSGVRTEGVHDPTMEQSIQQACIQVLGTHQRKGYPWPKQEEQQKINTPISKLYGTLKR